MTPSPVARIGNYVLGLELGVASLGWAALTLDAEGKPCAVLAVGARKFPVGAIGDIASGRDVTRNSRRQAAKSRRVHLARHTARLRAVWLLLQGAGLLPPGSFTERDAIVRQLDGAHTRNPYRLRALALDGPLAPHELGRALIHIAQRRGFQSNRKRAAKDDAELGVVRAGIADLETAMRAAGARTLGEYLYKQQGALRRRWTARSMYAFEADAILTVQQAHHPVLTSAFCSQLRRALFAQRPLKSKAGWIGRCELEPSRRRMPLAAPFAQELRVLQRVNDLRLVDDVHAEPVELTGAQRQGLLDLLGDGDASFASIRKTLGLGKTVRFNAERIDDKTLVGFRTEARMRKALGRERWMGLSAAMREAIVRDLVEIDEEAGVRKRLKIHGLTAEEIDVLVDTPLEPGYLNHSHKAAARLLVELRNSTSYATARKKLYPKADLAVALRDLPLVQEAYPRLHNPLVARALGELRVVMRALIAKYGRPTAVRIALQRELRLGRKSRERAHANMRSRQRERSVAAARLLNDLGVQEAPPWMIDKVLLAEECGWVCPFTGKAISIRALVGDAQFEVAHLVPLHQSLDDSFGNKTLCHVSALAEVKALRRRDEATFARFAQFSGPFAKEKLHRAGLTLEQIVEKYSEEALAAHFVDSCYASTLAVDYVARLFPPNSGAVTTTRGSITGYVHEGCGLRRIDVPQGNFKRHAIRAAAVALSGPRVVRTLCAAALGASPGRRRLSPEIVIPWPRFTEDVQNAVEAMNVSVRVDRRVSGALHEETFYSSPQVTAEGDRYHTTRKHLWQLTPTDIARIDGAEIRDVIEAKVRELGGGDPRKLFAGTKNVVGHPECNLPEYRGTRVRGVLVRRAEEAFAIGHNGHVRWVVHEENHHAAIFLRPGGKRADRVIVSQFEAQRRLVKREPIVQYPQGVTKLGTLAVGETVEIKRRLMTVRSVSKDPRISLVAIDDGRPLAKIIADKKLVRYSVQQLHELGAKKVVITPLGEVRRAKD
jgi:CRISPR-associated endonuclease Csn1